MKSGSDQHQSKITKYFQIVSVVSCLVQGNPDVKKILENVNVNCDMVEAVAVSISFLQRLMSNEKGFHFTFYILRLFIIRIHLSQFVTRPSIFKNRPDDSFQ